MKNHRLRNKYSVKQTLAYYIYAYNEMNKDNEKINIRTVVSKIIVMMKTIDKNVVLELIDENVLKEIPFLWEFNSQEVLAYAFTVFYVLLNRKDNITEEKIVREMLSELHMHRISRTLKEAEFIANQVFPDLLKNENLNKL